MFQRIMGGLAAAAHALQFTRAEGNLRRKAGTLDEELALFLRESELPAGAYELARHPFLLREIYEHANGTGIPHFNPDIVLEGESAVDPHLWHVFEGKRKGEDGGTCPISTLAARTLLLDAFDEETRTWRGNKLEHTPLHRLVRQFPSQLWEALNNELKAKCPDGIGPVALPKMTPAQVTETARALGEAEVGEELVASIVSDHMADDIVDVREMPQVERLRLLHREGCRPRVETGPRVGLEFEAEKRPSLQDVVAAAYKLSPPDAITTTRQLLAGLDEFKPGQWRLNLASPELIRLAPSRKVAETLKRHVQEAGGRISEVFCAPEWADHPPGALVNFESLRYVRVELRKDHAGTRWMELIGLPGHCVVDVHGAAADALTYMFASTVQLCINGEPSDPYGSRNSGLLLPVPKSKQSTFFWSKERAELMKERVDRILANDLTGYSPDSREMFDHAFIMGAIEHVARRLVDEHGVHADLARLVPAHPEFGKFFSYGDNEAWFARFHESLNLKPEQRLQIIAAIRSRATGAPDDPAPRLLAFLEACLAAQPEESKDD